MEEKKFTIQFIITGGTIDSHYDGSKDTAVPNKESVIPSFIQSLRLHNDTDFAVVCMKDSRDLNEEDLKNLLSAVEKSAYEKIVITHGTYTIAESARFLKANLKRKDQTIIFTASAIPLSGFAPSDGPFSLGYAVAKNLIPLKKESVLKAIEQIVPEKYRELNINAFNLGYAS